MHGEPAGRAREEQWGPLGRLALGLGIFASAVSLGLFFYGISPVASSIVSGLFVAAGIVARRRETTQAGHAAAVSAIGGGLVAVVASIVLAATGV